MLGVKSYEQSYVDECRSNVESLLRSYEAVASTSKSAAVKDFEPKFFNDMVLALDHFFMHRLRGQEKKDGNPLNEVRVLSASLMEHGGIMTADGTINLKAEESVTGIDYGEQILLDENTFTKLAEAFLAEIEEKFPA